MDRSGLMLRWLLIFVWTSRSSAVPPEVLAVGSVRGSLSERQERVLTIAEARLRRWLENGSFGLTLAPTNLRVSGAVTDSSLASVAAAHQVGSLLLLEPKGDEIRLLLFSQGIGLDEIPLSRPLKGIDVLNRPLADGLEVNREAFERLRASHHLAWGPPDHRTALDWAARPEPVVSKWYNNWVNWAVAGGILAGVLVACLAARASSVQPQPSAGLRVQLDRP